MANIQLIAKALIGLSTRETEELIQVLQDEYGITLANTCSFSAKENFECKKSLGGDAVSGLLITKNTQQQSRKGWYVPRKIGKPGKPMLYKRR